MANGVAIADNFLTYVGRSPYLWGGARPSGWDCSGACNYVICHDMGYDIPGYNGGTFSGDTHGPNTTIWLEWAGTVWVPRNSIRKGDLVIWPTHMGIVLAADEYVSAFDTQLGTVKEPIHGGGPNGETATFWRLKQRNSRGGTGQTGGGTGVGGPVGGPPPTAGKEWMAMQDAWTQLRQTLGPWGKGRFDKFQSIEHRAKRIRRG